MLDLNLLLLCAFAVIGITEWLKSFDKKNKLKPYYGFLPAILSIGVAVILLFKYDEPWYFGFIYWGACLGISVLNYDVIVKTIHKKLNAL